MGLFSLKRPSHHRHHLHTNGDKIHQHGAGVEGIIMQVLSADRKQRKRSKIAKTQRRVELTVLRSFRYFCRQASFSYVKGCIFRGTLYYKIALYFAPCLCRKPFVTDTVYRLFRTFITAVYD